MVTKVMARMKRLPNALARRANGALESLSVEIENRRGQDAAAERLIILDDYFPNLLSSFRVAEYHACLKRFPSAEVHSTGTALGEHKTFDGLLGEYESRHPEFKNRVLKFHRRRVLHGSAGYTVFLNNAYRFIESAEKSGLPFLFELYPGGGFRLDAERSDEKLRRVFSSHAFRKVIVTQPITRDYLLGKNFCEPAQIEFVFGGVVPSDRFSASAAPKRCFGADKETLDVCFVANKYMPGGVDKGYDRFVGAAKLLAERHGKVRFHVVGPFDVSDGDLSGLGGRLTFYGTRQTDFFGTFYAGMDIIVSPNASFLLAPGAFDGFPTGCCMEAGLCGVAVFCTDELRQNEGAFKEGEEIVIISREAQDIAEKVEVYLKAPARLAEFSVATRRAFHRVLDIEHQMKPRLKVLAEVMSVAEAGLAEKVG
jgi:glycosyltransferase involved in cell wall biosynthesis